jgi:hypothetical protein
MRPPAFRLAPQAAGALQRIGQSRRVHALHDEAGALLRIGRHVGHRIEQPPHGRDDRWRAIGLAVHLVEAAGLEARRHEEDVGAGLDQVGEALVEPQVHGHLLRVLARRVLERLLQPRFALAQHHQLRAGGQQPRQRAEHQVDALLRREPAHHREQHGRRSAAGPAAPAARLALRLALQVRGP